MKVTERKNRIKLLLDQMHRLAIEQENFTTPSEEALWQIVAASAPSYREILLCIIVSMMIDPTLKASEDWYAFHPRGIYDNGPVKQFLYENGIPHTKSGPLNISKASNINNAWVQRRESPDVANAVVTVVNYLEAHNTIAEIKAVGVSLIHKLLQEAVRVQALAVEIEPSSDPEHLTSICIQLINNAPDAGNTPQKIAGLLLKAYHYTIHSEITVTGSDDRASVTSTTSKKPGDINEEWCGHALKVYEITVKPFDTNRIVDSYDCLSKYNQHSEYQINEVIVICRPEDCPEQLQKREFASYLGYVDHQSVRYYFWDIFEWIASTLQRMPQDGREWFFRTLSGYINDINTSESVKVEWRKIHGIE